MWSKAKIGMLHNNVRRQWKDKIRIIKKTVNMIKWEVVQNTHLTNMKALRLVTETWAFNIFQTIHSYITRNILNLSFMYRLSKKIKSLSCKK